jgi:hypothetical protein
MKKKAGALPGPVSEIFSFCWILLEIGHFHECASASLGRDPPCTLAEKRRRVLFKVSHTPLAQRACEMELVPRHAAVDRHGSAEAAQPSPAQPGLAGLLVAPPRCTVLSCRIGCAAPCPARKNGRALCIAADCRSNATTPSALTTARAAARHSRQEAANAKAKGVRRSVRTGKRNREQSSFVGMQSRSRHLAIRSRPTSVMRPSCTDFGTLIQYRPSKRTQRPHRSFGAKSAASTPELSF